MKPVLTMCLWHSVAASMSKEVISGHQQNLLLNSKSVDSVTQADSPLKFLQSLAQRLHDSQGLPQQVKDEEPWEVQHEIERMVARMERLGDSTWSAEFAEELSGLEEEEGQLAESAGDEALVAEVSKTRATLCSEQGFQNHEYQACRHFMHKVCHEGHKHNHALDRPSPVSTTLCHRFFLKKRAEVQAPGAVPPVLAPAPAASLSYSPAGAVFPGILGGKADRPLPDQGYTGKAVKHEDLNTQTDDWQREFGPKAGHRSIADICKDFPDNEWCRLHTYHPSAKMYGFGSTTAQKSRTSNKSCSLALLIAVVLGVLFQGSP